MQNDLIPDALYKDILEYLPIVTVDIIVWSPLGFLMGKRKNPPMKDAWWVPGGRLLKGEQPEDAVHRKVREETGLEITHIKFLGFKNLLFGDSAFGPATHCVDLIYRAEVREVTDPTSDNQHSDLQWFSYIDPQWDERIRDVLTLDHTLNGTTKHHQ